MGSHTQITKLPSAVAAAALLFTGSALGAPNPQTPIAGSTISQFVQPLPRLSVQPGGTLTTIVATGTSFASPLQLSICEFKAQVLPPPMPATWVWGYLPVSTCPDYAVASPPAPRDTYIGPVLVNVKGTPTTIRFTNSLPTVDETNVLAYKFSTDQTLHWADPLGVLGHPQESNHCHMESGNPPQVGVGIPDFQSPCSLNFGEDPNNPGTYLAKGIAAVPHLHGGEVPPVLDGGPDAWFTSFNGDGSVEQGHGYYTNPLVPTAPNEAVYSYPNTQGAAPLWFHDHTLGATRLNVYAGIAGAYYLLDPDQEAHFQQIHMRPVTEVIPIVLQDRMFDTNGQFFFPADFPGGLNGPPPNPQHPYWNPEFLGDVIVVNGKAWPFLDVEPRRYRFLFLNGSNARTYEMFFKDQKSGALGPAMWVIGNDGGFLDYPSLIDSKATTTMQPHFVIMPGERYEIIADFTHFAGKTLILKNVAKAPYPGGTAPHGRTTGQLMQFRVSATPVADTSYDPSQNTSTSPGAVPLRPTPIVRLTDPTKGTVWPGVTISKVRQLTLNEVALDEPQTVTDPITGVTQTYPGGPFEVLVNNTPWSGVSARTYDDFEPVTIPGAPAYTTAYISETPQEGDTELWEIVNTTEDAHPIHTHLTTFQVLNRQGYDTKRFGAAYAAAFPAVPGSSVCTGGVYCPAFGPPLHYDPNLNPLSGGKYGGNPDVTPYSKNAIQLPLPDEVGWKDTFLVYPGMVNRIIVRFAPTDTPHGTIAGYPFSPNDGTNGSVNDSHGYVWHCHIIDHEDNEMMRPDVIVPLAGATRAYVKGVDY